jgi:hypothetical protein
LLERDNITLALGLGCRDSYFDLIHAREVLPSLINFPNFKSDVQKALRPGGSFVCAEIDWTIYDRNMERLVSTVRGIDSRLATRH